MYNDFIKTDVTHYVTQYVTQYKYYAYAFKYLYNNSLIFDE
jgi:hypothetical protein